VNVAGRRISAPEDQSNWQRDQKSQPARQAQSSRARTADSSSKNAVSFSSGPTMKPFPLPRCASAIQILRPSESIAATQPKLHPALLSVSNYFPILHLELCSRHCLLFNTSPNDSEQHDGNDSSPSQEGPVKIKLTSHLQLCRAGCVFPL